MAQLNLCCRNVQFYELLWFYFSLSYFRSQSWLFYSSRFSCGTSKFNPVYKVLVFWKRKLCVIITRLSYLEECVMLETCNFFCAINFVDVFRYLRATLPALILFLFFAFLLMIKSRLLLSFNKIRLHVNYWSMEIISRIS